MRILVSNDDGIDAPGINHLAKALRQVGEVTIVAPHRERSTAGHSLTLHKPLRIKEVGKGTFAVSGTPADCIYMATRKIMSSKPDVIVSGINRGANLGNDVYYSGTVAAAREGVYSGIKSIAISLCFDVGCADDFLHWDTASQFALKFVPQVVALQFLNSVINVNVPNLKSDKVKGVKLSRLGLRYYDDRITEAVDPRGKPYFWIGGKYKGFRDVRGTDCSHIDEGYISITPLKTDSTDDLSLEELKTWETN